MNPAVIARPHRRVPISKAFIGGTFTRNVPTGVAYSSDLLLSGGVGTYTLGNGGTGILTGTLPAGLALSIVTVSGSKYLRLSGTATQTANTATFTVSVDCDGYNGTAVQVVDVRWYWAFFTAGEVGTILDVNDLATLYQDTAHTIPVTCAGQSVNAIRCKATGNYAVPGTANTANLRYDTTHARFYLSYTAGSNMDVTVPAGIQGNLTRTGIFCAELWNQGFEPCYRQNATGGNNSQFFMENNPTFLFGIGYVGSGLGTNGPLQTGPGVYMGQKNGNDLTSYRDGTILAGPTTLGATNTGSGPLRINETQSGAVQVARFYFFGFVNRVLTAGEKTAATAGALP